MPRPLRNGTFAIILFVSSCVQLWSIHSANLCPGSTPLTSWKVNSLNLVKSALFRSLNSNSMGSDGSDGRNAACAGGGVFGQDPKVVLFPGAVDYDPSFRNIYGFGSTKLAGSLIVCAGS